DDAIVTNSLGQELFPLSLGDHVSDQSAGGIQDANTAILDLHGASRRKPNVHVAAALRGAHGAEIRIIAVDTPLTEQSIASVEADKRPVRLERQEHEVVSD